MPPQDSIAAHEYTPDEACARRLDAADPLAAYRDRFHIPKRPDGSDVIYLAGNSLGLQPKCARAAIEQELDDWAAHGVDGHFKADTPWYTYHEQLRAPAARLVGARSQEVVVMNSLTVNLHLMMETFYRPTKTRYKILMEQPAFPSDTYAVKTQLARHGINADRGLVIVQPHDGRHIIDTGDFEQPLDEQGHEIAMVLLGGVNFFTGQVFDMARIVVAARKHGCIVGLDLAHAIGNVEIHLHDWQADFAVWCNYKYLNGGPGAVGGCFVNECHAKDISKPRLGGWWGNDPTSRFRMHLQPEFVPVPTADGWQISNPPILALAAVKASYDLFDEVGMAALREKSQRLTGFMRFLLERLGTDRVEVITPPGESGCQLSVLVHDRPKELHQSLIAAGVVADFREPNVVRVAPVPLYNTFEDVWRFAQRLAAHVEATP